MRPDPLEGTRLVAEAPATAWCRPWISEDLAAVAGVAPVWLVLHENGQNIDASVEAGASPTDPYWRAADRLLDGAAIHLEDVRDATGALAEVVGPCAPALASKRFRRAALARLGARQAFAATVDGRTVRLRDAWRLDPAQDVAALGDPDALLGGAVWLVAEDGVRGVVHNGAVIDTSGGVTPLVAGASGPPERSQVVFARALLAFMGGLVLALALALVLATR